MTFVDQYTRVLERGRYLVLLVWVLCMAFGGWKVLALSCKS